MSVHNSRLLFLGSDHELKFIHEDGKISLPALAEGEILARISLTAVCGRDADLAALGVARVHAPCVPGHEAVAEVIESRRASLDLEPGQRIVFSLIDVCQKCVFCMKGQGQYCTKRKKYGDPLLSTQCSYKGTFSSHIILGPGTTVVKLPDNVPDREAVTANCSLSLAMAAVSMTTEYGDPVLIQGATLTGLYACAALKERGVDTIYCTDKQVHRALKAQPFGATVIHPDLPEFGDSLTEGGISVVIDTLGTLESLKKSIYYLRCGGLYVIVDRSWGFGTASIPQRYILDKALTVKGLNDPSPADLQKAVDFLASTHGKYTNSSLLDPETRSLKDFHRAIVKVDQPEYCRLIIKP